MLEYYEYSRNVSELQCIHSVYSWVFNDFYTHYTMKKQTNNKQKTNTVEWGNKVKVTYYLLYEM